MNFRRGNMSNSAEYRIDLNSPNDLEQTETIGEEILHQIETTTHQHSHSPPPPPPTTNPSGEQTTGVVERPTRVGMTDDHLHQIIQFCKDNLTSTFPFALILILKGFYDHSAGIFMVIFFSASIYHGNTVLVHQSSLKSNRDKLVVLRVMIILLISLIVFLYLFRDDQFYKCLIFSRPNYSQWDLWTLIWVLYSTFCLVKMFVMILKGLLILYPLSLDKGKYSLKCRQRGSMFAFIEYTSQYYISLLTIRPWIEFLLNQNEKSFYFSTFLFLLYLLFKVFNLYKSTKFFYKSIKESFETLPFPSVSNVDLRENLCPICQSEYQHPILLTCKHVFCEECVLSWIDRNASCPLCRHKLPIGQTNYRDGFTSGFLIWY